MNDYVIISEYATPVNLSGLGGVFGIVNGFKLKSVLHGGRRISLADNTYFYVPSVNRVVTYKASKAKELVVTNGKFNFAEKFGDRKGQWSFKPDAATIYDVAFKQFK
jgi:hypothetical protein